ncbi:MlaD family protein [Antrihabitans sp. YC2-6]|uniref:MlaD family protein n=1 Tax=Antrihabitans sp. YC2-6 TaxID=2799498 RepID=UPI0018F5218D|nr:MlaD family protein [Antrihabitans sp. YC2-6]MBJ8344437.1 MCE family protein [Antrihabitans sp. YC2-6]
MQTLNQRSLRRFGFASDKPILHGAALERHELRWGIAGAVVVALALVASAVIFVVPLGKSTYTADLSEAGSIKVGDGVRLAGVPVGKVTSLELRSDTVHMTFTVDSDVFLGDQTTLDIRMLTIVGGHYVAVTPAGTSALGKRSIPADHVRLPYSLSQVFQDAATPISDVDGETLRKNFAAAQSAIASSPEGIRRTGNAIESLVDVLERQNDDVSRMLAFVDEYLTAVNASKSVLGDMITRINLMETIAIDKRAEIDQAITTIGEVLSRIAALEPTWQSTLKPMAHKLAEAIPEMQRLSEKLGGVVVSVQDLLSRLQHVVSPQGGVLIDQASATIAAPALCIPVPGKAC